MEAKASGEVEVVLGGVSISGSKADVVAGETRILLINPNTAESVTALLAAEARRAAGSRAEIVAVTAAFGAPGIQTVEEAKTAVRAVVEALRANAGCDAAITAAFLDPGFEEATALGIMPVVGFGRAGLRAAGAGGRRFALVTAGAAMEDAVRARIDELGLAPQLAGLRLVRAGVRDLIADRAGHRAEVLAAVRACVELDGAEAVLLGGAPFAGFAEEIAAEAGAPVLDGVAAAVEAALEARRGS
ncbi:aspartate/glutamate racemase family protein [Methylopila capsulata]|nr:aspartate/glutamate racemase family protein [Methylopila capsulata]